ncbi:hypothetical protein GCK72_015379 [Caenorhabditis remanei]|uniref:Tyrosine-protein phosphatase domain-containing protein n=1 Tax=Caenorhabditis remanei TaxID=31234 RepID=A0A6A5GWI9_CAERE|nr:hypothetical protein GCK72_015379 [Caenorhabditis remanei]KAF1758919.1 hypothetical protein GCK72_015379 [Caenorhabditis remanei]
MHHLNPFLWITICIVVSNGLLDENSDPDSRDLSSSGYDQNLKADFSNSLNFTEYLRNPRNAKDKSSEYLNHITSIAHITNGIALQNGLMNGNVQIDSVIEELLNLGTVKLSSVLQFKPDKIKNFGSKLKIVPGKFDNSAAELEKQALRWNKWYNKYLSVKDVTFDKIPRSSEYFVGAKTINSSKSLENFKMLKESVNGIAQDITLAETRIKEKLEGSAIALLAATFTGLHEKAEKFFNSYNSLKKEIEEKLANSLLIEGHVIFEPLESMLEVMKGRKVIVQSTDALITTIKSNVEIAVGLAKDSTAADTDISLITELMKSQNGIKSNQHTIGFPNGASDMKQLEKDAVDSWIAKILNLDVTRLSALSDSLKPLFHINEKLDGLDGKVKSIASDKSYESLLKLQEIQKDLVVVSDDSANSVGVLKEYDECITTAKSASDTTVSDDFISNVHELTKGLMDIEKLVNDLKDDTLKQEVDEYLKSLGFTNIVDEPTVRSQLPQAVERYNGGNNLEKIKKHVTDLQSKLAVVNGADLQSKLSSVVAANGKITDQNFKDEIGTLGKIHDCLQKHLANSDKSSKAIQAIQNLKGIDTKSIDDVESLATTISEISKGLSGIQSIRDVMKKDVKEVTKEINKLDDSTTKSEVIGQSMVSLKYALGLVELETEIGLLKGLGDAVEAEIRKLVVFKEKMGIQKQWGDHKKDIDDLEKSLAGIKSFDRKLNVSMNGTLVEYSTPLTQLTSFNDVKVDFKGKSKALEALITQPKIDPNLKSELEKAQKTLDKLSNLDLEFSSHSVQYTSAPSAFLALQDFLTKFLSIDHNITVIEEKAAAFPWTIVAGVALSLIILFFTGMTASFFWERHKSRRGYMKARLNAWREKGASSDELMLWVRGRRYKSSKKWSEVHNGTETIVRHKERQCEKVKIPKKFKKVSRSPGVIRCNPATAVSYKYGIFPWTRLTIHANWIVTADGKEFIATQAPVKNEDGLRNTDVDFWRMVIMSKSDTIVMLCKKMEMFEGKEFRVCGEYFSEEEATQIQCGPYTIATLCVMPLANDVIKRTLSVTYKNFTKEITHYQFVNWSLSSHPPDHANVLELMKEVYKSNKPIVVHCTDGAARTMDFIALRYIYEEVIRDATIVFGDCCLKLRDCRWYSFQNAIQSQWVEAGVVRQIKMAPHQEEIDEIYQKLLNYLNREK